MLKWTKYQRSNPEWLGDQTGTYRKGRVMFRSESGYAKWSYTATEGFRVIETENWTEKTNNDCFKVEGWLDLSKTITVTITADTPDGIFIENVVIPASASEQPEAKDVFKFVKLNAPYAPFFDVVCRNNLIYVLWKASDFVISVYDQDYALKKSVILTGSADLQTNFVRPRLCIAGDNSLHVVGNTRQGTLKHYAIAGNEVVPTVIRDIVPLGIPKASAASASVGARTIDDYTITVQLWGEGIGEYVYQIHHTTNGYTLPEKVSLDKPYRDTQTYTDANGDIYASWKGLDKVGYLRKNVDEIWQMPSQHKYFGVGDTVVDKEKVYHAYVSDNRDQIFIAVNIFDSLQWETVVLSEGLASYPDYENWPAIAINDDKLYVAWGVADPEKTDILKFYVIEYNVKTREKQQWINECQQTKAGFIPVGIVNGKFHAFFNEGGLKTAVLEKEEQQPEEPVIPPDEPKEPETPSKEEFFTVEFHGIDLEKLRELFQQSKAKKGKIVVRFEEEV